jgi:hypothetical protein
MFLLFHFLSMAVPFCCTCCNSNLYHPSYIILYYIFFFSICLYQTVFNSTFLPTVRPPPCSDLFNSTPRQQENDFSLNSSILSGCDLRGETAQTLIACGSISYLICLTHWPVKCLLRIYIIINGFRKINIWVKNRVLSFAMWRRVALRKTTEVS